MALSEQERDAIERILIRDRDRILRHLRRFDESLAEEAGHAFGLHIADQGTDMMEKEKAFLLAGEEGRRLLEVNTALRRLREDPHGFGTCRICGGEISFARLEAVPQATLCVACKKAEEESE